MVKIEKKPYGGWNNCVEISNGIVALVVTTDVGPRIIRYGFTGAGNEFSEVNADLGKIKGDKWRIYGGHRLWHSPEDSSRTYEPDNYPVKWENIRNGIRTIQDTEKRTGIQKEMEITLSHDTARVNLLHRLTNKGAWTVRLSVWSITAMATGGKEVIPLTGKDTGLLPNRSFSLWPYSRLNDPRLFLGEKFLVLHQEPGNKAPFKLGLSNHSGLAAYFNNKHLFLKYYSHIENASYPDFGSSYETYTNDYMLELETLSPLNLLKPGDAVEHPESWDLVDNVEMPGNYEPDIEAILKDKANY